MNVEQIAKEDAAEAIAIARASDEAVVFITGNSMMPPLRAFGRAEHVWKHDYTECGMDKPSGSRECLWVLYTETFEAELHAANVYMDCPEYDNAIFVVDMERFEYVESDDAEEWRRIPCEVHAEFVNPMAKCSCTL